MIWYDDIPGVPGREFRSSVLVVGQSAEQLSVKLEGVVLGLLSTHHYRESATHWGLFFQVMIQLAVDQKSCSAVSYYLSQTCSTGTHLTILSSLFSSVAACLIFLSMILPPLLILPLLISRLFSLMPLKGSYAETCISVNRNTARSDVPRDSGTLPVIWCFRSGLY